MHIINHSNDAIKAYFLEGIRMSIFREGIRRKPLQNLIDEIWEIVGKRYVYNQT